MTMTPRLPTSVPRPVPAYIITGPVGPFVQDLHCWMCQRLIMKGERYYRIRTIQHGTNPLHLACRMELDGEKAA